MSRLIPVHALYSAAAIRRLEHLLIEEHEVPGYTLMNRAGDALFQHIRAVLPAAGRTLILTGPGNNGGDGYVVARLLREAGYGVEVVSLCDPRTLGGDAACAYTDWRVWGDTRRFDGSLPERCDLVIDAMLGTGLQRRLSGEFLVAVQLANAYPAMKMAVDIPSGLSSDTGCALDSAFIADETVTFIGHKPGLFTGEAGRYTGRVTLHTLGTLPDIYAGVPSSAHLDQPEILSNLLPKRRADAHKGDFGHALLIGGNSGMGGAARLAAEAALRSGAGKVSLATHPGHAALTSAARPEIMAHSIDDATGLDSLLTSATTVGLGPGLGTDIWSRALWEKAIACGKPMVVDADALNLLAQTPLKQDNWVLTPHPGEAARLLKCTAADIAADRFAAARTIQRQYGGITVLKGFGTLVCDANALHVCAAGNPGMASGGMGDVLTGIITAMLAQGLSALQAARAGVMIHSHSADLVAEDKPRGLIASDLFAALRGVINP